MLYDNLYSLQHYDIAMKKGFFITGTDTSVGKTFVTAGILQAMQAAGYNVCPMKPVETGCSISKGRLVTDDALRLLKVSCIDEDIDLINPYRFRQPLAPLIAAAAEDKRVSKKRIISAYNNLKKKYEVLLVEGAGGIMVPLTRRTLFVDLIKEMDIPLIIIARPGLGTINHTLLTIEAARSNGIQIEGVVFNHTEKSRSDISVKTNPEVVRRIGKVKILGEVPFSGGRESLSQKKAFRTIAERIL
jgi:dethiobiotin synthetase